jgi:hypothetical protein
MSGLVKERVKKLINSDHKDIIIYKDKTDKTFAAFCIIIDEIIDQISNPTIISEIKFKDSTLKNEFAKNTIEVKEEVEENKDEKKTKEEVLQHDSSPEPVKEIDEVPFLENEEKENSNNPFPEFKYESPDKKNKKKRFKRQDSEPIKEIDEIPFFGNGEKENNDSIPFVSHQDDFLK